MTRSFLPVFEVFSFTSTSDKRAPIVCTSEGEIKFFRVFFFFFFTRESVVSKKEKGETLTGGSKNGGDVRVGGGRRRTHVEDITLRVKAQSFFRVRFVRGAAVAKGCVNSPAVVKMEDPCKCRSSKNTVHPLGPKHGALRPADHAACHFTLHPGLHLSLNSPSLLSLPLYIFSIFFLSIPEGPTSCLIFFFFF